MPVLIAMLTPILWGTTFAVVNLNLSDLSPFWVSVYRALPAGLLLLLCVRRMPEISWARLILLAFCNITAFFCLLFLAAYHLPGAVAGTLSAIMPLSLMLLEWIGYRKLPDTKRVVVALIGVTGVVFLLNPSANLDPFGVLCAIISTLLVAQSAIWINQWPVKDVLGFTAWQLTIGGILLIPVAFIFAGAPAPVNMGEVPALIWLIVPNTALAYAIMTWSIRKIGPALVSLLTPLNPVVAVTLGVILVGEQLSSVQYIGIALVIGALIAIKLPTGRSQKMLLKDAKS